MYQRPQQRRTLNSVKPNSAFLNHNQQMPPPPPPPQQFTHRRSTGTAANNSAQHHQQQQHQQQPPSHVHRPPPRSPGDMSFGSNNSASNSTPNLYGAASAHHQPSQNAAYPQHKPANSYAAQHNSQNHYGEVRLKNNRGGSSGFSCGFFLLWTCLLAGGGWIYFNYFLLPNLVHDATKEEVEHTKHHWMTKYHTLQLAHEALEKSHVELKQTAEAAIVAAEKAQKLNGSTNSEQVQQLGKEVEDLNGQLEQERTWAGEWKQKAIGLEEHADFVKHQIQEFSKRRLIQKYGYRELAVELELNFGNDDNAWITIELAPIDEMPHSVFTFLEQVELGLYDDGGYAFHHNGEHIIMGAPVFNQLTPPDMDPAQRFDESGVASVLFQEYSYGYTHQAYTVGFAGRPGGPNFYFNTQDNSELHGPGGYAEDGSADPCFGRVTRGMDIIDRIHSLTGQMERGDWKELMPFVAVRWVKILN
mmetsp:Transcript_6017/g.14251  ORF Transcript_6017/g.14251 Transcript_6017/m.14251 type:complete len:473 (-) Transcript_6017:253-1671(-)|eukprot:CAMPEP_0113648404 /NCGR_PEP_ID=MMETSP0017_2-20120614/25672_1 /TAXON_ID=2856 /ORGANISM="Cylindrotheca closterium" /LENGTH=472 /DNA_ID=CAMNT_0000560617 /DNA_START=336 /DNA_END=1754 /DNA_ORIENTATION=+ /assembly_acc=CAM_ASM_000147